MGTWTVTDVKDRFAEIIRASLQEPQIVYEQNKPVSVVVDVNFFNQLMDLRARQARPTIAELLDELREIHQSEPVEIEVPTRQDRPNAMLEIAE
ncbi:MAG: type II toxin-antitoxin system Phd/YefM family antitoxin [candidate division KSB1 bacterium]|nr:type II toxin-antitoxin system Phd/YefM family antitoxin [candidate division KSB1 bacterium]MDZ7302261.1 type II toxin-antitoxin system Phd/YefM family antitoxin [candidate division KSB1 bacterium]MDZ7311367.1 type II toxin-antitoxin system Phd/YefM family antitoxin [candidate division KSB1 bacterium]